MDNFYTIVLIIAVIALIGILTYIGIIMSYGEGTVAYPPHSNTCPDYWTEGTDGICTSAGLNTGDGTVTSTADGTGNNVTGDTRCEKRIWAIEKGIMWSGVSNYNSCNYRKINF